eukprot:ANDGO_06116.mRNA.1 hypothetical protein
MTDLASLEAQLLAAPTDNNGSETLAHKFMESPLQPSSSSSAAAAAVGPSGSAAGRSSRILGMLMTDSAQSFGSQNLGAAVTTASGLSRNDVAPRSVPGAHLNKIMYTKEFLISLRDSPLVKGANVVPAIIAKREEILRSLSGNMIGNPTRRLQSSASSMSSNAGSSSSSSSSSSSASSAAFSSSRGRGGRNGSNSRSAFGEGRGSNRNSGHNSNLHNAATFGGGRGDSLMDDETPEWLSGGGADSDLSSMSKATGSLERERIAFQKRSGAFSKQDPAVMAQAADSVEEAASSQIQQSSDFSGARKSRFMGMFRNDDGSLQEEEGGAAHLPVASDDQDVLLEPAILESDTDLIESTMKNSPPRPQQQHPPEKSPVSTQAHHVHSRLPLHNIPAHPGVPASPNPKQEEVINLFYQDPHASLGRSSSGPRADSLPHSGVGHLPVQQATPGTSFHAPGMPSKAGAYGPGPAPSHMLPGPPSQYQEYFPPAQPPVPVNANAHPAAMQGPGPGPGIQGPYMMPYMGSHQGPMAMGMPPHPGMMHMMHMRPPPHPGHGPMMMGPPPPGMAGPMFYPPGPGMMSGPAMYGHPFAGVPNQAPSGMDVSNSGPPQMVPNGLERWFGPAGHAPQQSQFDVSSRNVRGMTAEDLERQLSSS